MKAAVDTGIVARALSAHAVIGLLAGALLYIVCLTGTVVVFYEEWQRIEQPAAPEMEAISPEAVQLAIARVLETERDKKATAHLYVHLPVDTLPRTTITTDHQAVHIDPNGAIAVPEENGWSEFLLNLHYRLMLPSTLGLTIVGALGVMILALSISGIVAHPRIFRDAFRLRAQNAGGVGLADWHNRLGVWTLPFAVAVALTGAMIGLGQINGYGLAASFYHGDIEAAYAPIFGAEAKPDARPAPLPDVTRALSQMRIGFPEATPQYVVLHDPLTAGQHIQVIAGHRRRLIFGEYYNFDADGRLLGTAGLSDGALGQQMAASAYNLHFGNFGGLPVKIAYVTFGLALSVITATGVSIWLGKRRRRGIDEPRLRNAWDAVTWGVPIALTLCFLSRLVIGNGAPFTLIFWGAAALTLFGAVLPASRWRAKPHLQRLLVAGLLASILVAATG